MLLEKLYIRNLNSLAGAWEIDFRAAPYERDRLFVIAGPTGAGKSTILDAICLALYGTTPRLGRLTGNSNEIITRGAGECQAEATFTARGESWRASYYQYRSRKRPDGNLQKYTHKLVRIADGRAVREDGKAVPALVADRTGLDYDRFTRSALLAQGGFAEFLKSPPAARADLLEKITGTEIYSRISAATFEKARSRREELKALKAGLDSMQALTPEEEAELARQLAEAEREAAALQEALGLRRREAALLKAAADAEAELEAHRAKGPALEAALAAFAPESARLMRGRAAEGAEAAWARFGEAERQGLLAGEALKRRRDSVPETQARLQAAQGLRNEAEEALKAAGDALSEALPRIEAARKLSSRAASENKVLEELRKADKDRAAALSRLRDEIAGGVAWLKEAAASRDKDLARLETECAPAGLRGELAGIEEEARALDGLWREEAETAGRAEKAGAAMAAGKAQAEKAAAAHSGALERRGAALARLQGLEAERLQALEGASPEEWTARRKALSLRHGRLREAVIACGSRAEALSELRGKEDRARETLRGLGELVESEKAAAERGRELESSRSLADENLRLNIAVKGLTQHREALREGEPCPLCGSLEHPWAGGAEARVDEAQARLKAAERACALHREAEKKLAARKSALESEGAGLMEEIPRLRDKGEKALADLRRSLEGEGLPDPEEGGPEFPGLLAEAAAAAEAGLKAAEGALALAALADKRINAERQELDLASQLAAGKALELKDAENRRDRAEEELARLGSELEGRRARSAEDSGRLAARIRPYTGEIPAPGRLETILGSLRKRLAERTRIEEGLASLEGEMARRAEAVRVQSAETGPQEEKILAERLHIDEVRRGLEAILAEKRALLGDLEPDSEEERLRAAGARAAEAARRREAEAARLESELKGAVKAEAEAAERAREALEELRARELELAAALREKGFLSPEGEADREAFLAARLSPEDRESLEGRKAALDGEAAEHRSLLQEKETRLAEARVAAAAVPGAFGEAENAARDLEGKLQAVHSRKGAVGQKLKDNDRAKKAAARKLEEYARLEAAGAATESLNSLIGSSDGAKYKKIVQSLNMDVLVDNANFRLTGMSGGRYELRQPEGHSLEIFVKDLFQGGARRPANTLSGGETFIVSLAMALGLSDMASRKCAVESLFLDEGFGTLDDESLDSAIGALIELSLPDGDKGGGLHRKTVGLISHVAALKERIPAQINVIPIGKGMSRLEGPGCRHIGPDERERLEEMAKDV